MFQLDRAVWEIRRSCTVLDYEITTMEGKKVRTLPHELSRIKRSEREPYHHFKLMFGALEKTLADKNHPARAALVYHNLYFGARKRDRLTYTRHSHSSNSPLYLHPEILDDVLKYVYFPKDVAAEYRALAESRKKTPAGT